MQITDPVDTRELGPNRLIPLETFLAGNHIDALDYVYLLLLDDVPAPIAVGNRLYLFRSDASCWNSGLLGTAARRRSELLEHARSYRP